MSPDAPMGRGPKVRAAVLAAALAELVEAGYADLSVDSVARRAGVHKTTVYRRWKDRESLIEDVLSDHVATQIRIPDTGSAESDLCALARGLTAWLTSPRGKAILAVMLAGQVQGAHAARVGREVFQSRIRQASPIVENAIARGELPAGTDPAQLIKALAAPIYLRLIITGDPVDDATADNAARAVLAAAKTGLFQ